MKKISLMLIMTVYAMLLISCGQDPTNSDATSLMPSKALEKMGQELADMPKEEREEAAKSLAEKYLAEVSSDNLSSDEELSYADLLSSAGRTEEADQIIQRIASGDDIAARNASIKLMMKMIEQEDYASLETAVEKYRQQFKPSPDFTTDISTPLQYLVFSYLSAGNHEKVVEIVDTELQRLPLEEAPYRFINMLGFLRDSYNAVGQDDAYLARLQEIHDTCQEIIDQRAANAPEDAGEGSEYVATTQGYVEIQQIFQSTLSQAKLIGSPAPDFTFTNYFNTDPISLADLKGKVVMIDFWANWCGPCKAAFPSMRQLYADYKDQGFVILGVTGLQGRFFDGDIQEPEVSQEKELELTEDFIARHEMTWPVVFSEQGALDQRYGVTGIPTFAIIDKNGIVRMLQVGSGAESERVLREIVPKLLAE